MASALVSLALISHAVSFRDSIGPVALAVVFGLIVIALSSRAKDVQNERLLLTVGLSASAVAPAAVALAARGSWSRLALSLLAATAMLAIALGRFRPRRAENRQAIEVSSLGVAGGVPLLLSLPNARSDIALSALTLAVGVVFLAIAVWRKRLLLSAATTALLLGVIGIQYFAKLSQAFHWGLLCVGFGFVLLTLAVLHERKLKSVWPKLERWER